MAREENKALDQRVLSALSDDPVTFTALMVRLGVPRSEFRTVDRSLQRLRRRQAIRFTATGWTLDRRWEIKDAP